MPGQAATLDALGLPWRFDPDLGALIAQKGETCDGQYMWDEGMCVTNPHPATQEQLDARLAESVAATVALVEKQRQARGQIRRSPSLSQTSSSDANDDADASESPDAGDANARAPKSHAAAQRKPRVRDDDGALDRCKIERTARPNGGRSDMKIVTPDGRTFRSKVSALAHMTAHDL